MTPKPWRFALRDLFGLTFVSALFLTVCILLGDWFVPLAWVTAAGLWSLAMLAASYAAYRGAQHEFGNVLGCAIGTALLLIFLMKISTAMPVDILALLILPVKLPHAVMMQSLPRGMGERVLSLHMATAMSYGVLATGMLSYLNGYWKGSRDLPAEEESTADPSSR